MTSFEKNLNRPLALAILFLFLSILGFIMGGTLYLTIGGILLLISLIFWFHFGRYYKIYSNLLKQLLKTLKEEGPLTKDERLVRDNLLEFMGVAGWRYRNKFKGNEKEKSNA